MDFKIWIEQFRNDDTFVGDLAYDIWRDAGFPKSNDYAVIASHISRMSKNDIDVKQALRQAWKEYENREVKKGD